MRPRSRSRLLIVASVTVGLGAFLFAAVFSGLLFGAPKALAHRPTYATWADCYYWEAEAEFGGGSGRRLLIISNVVVNGAP